MADASAASVSSLGVVMPAYNAATELTRSLPPLVRSGATVLVVDPESEDDTAAIAESLGASVLRLGRRAGPAEARNAGMARMNSPVVLFVDSDCVVHDDVLSRVDRAFAAEEDLVSLCGSYDDAPRDSGFFSQYMNLRHHYVHQRARREGAGFWAGCGAVRRDAFEAVGGFDAGRYPSPMIEDIELGVRLGDQGMTRLDPEIFATHLKRWTGFSVIHTDIFRRAIPWTRLLLEKGRIPDDLNLRWSWRLVAMIAPLVLAALGSIPWLIVSRPEALMVPAAIVVASLWLQRDLAIFFARRRGPVFATMAFVFHQVHLSYSGATFLLTALSWKFGLGRRTSS